MTSVLVVTCSHYALFPPLRGSRLQQECLVSSPALTHVLSPVLCFPLSCLPHSHLCNAIWIQRIHCGRCSCPPAKVGRGGKQLGVWVGADLVQISGRVWTNQWSLWPMCVFIVDSYSRALDYPEKWNRIDLIWKWEQNMVRIFFP